GGVPAAPQPAAPCPGRQMAPNAKTPKCKRPARWRAFPVSDAAQNLFCLCSFQTGAVSCAFGRGVTVNEFDDRHRSHVAIAEAGLQDADIATLTVFVARGQNVEEFGNVFVFFESSSCLTAGMQVTALCQRDQLFDDRTQFLRF